MTITAADIAKLRAMTGAGMMDCKGAMEEAQGDMEKAADILRKKGIVKAAKRADKIASEGMVTGYVSADNKVGALVEVNCETDFVSGSDNFVAFANNVAKAIVENKISDEAALMNADLGGETVQSVLNNLGLTLGEKISVRRFALYNDNKLVATYLHGKKMGIMVELEGGTVALGMDVALHIAASNPKCVDRTGVDPELVEREKAIYIDQLKQQGKPENMIENIVKGKLEKFYAEISLTEQPFIKNEEIKVGK
ncbi:MAG: translation elongation factor Ts [Candidatus Magasanikbacteria bacterium]|nr:translation elongation factor Ts [Candidatus Magasanikbacteria bacterium]